MRLSQRPFKSATPNWSRRDEPQYKMGDKVMLNSKNLRKRLKRARKSAKFYPRFVGPFSIVKAEPETSNYKLDLPPEYASVHPNFHARLLKPFIENDTERFPLREPPRPPPVVPEDDQYEVEAILDHREKGRGQMRRKEYLDMEERIFVFVFVFVEGERRDCLALN